MKSFKWRIGGILIAVVLFAGALTGIAFADSSDQSGFTRADLYQDFVAKFAANLGLEQDKVTAALEATKDQMLAEAVQQGKLTQEQADKIAAGKITGLKGLCFGYGKMKEHGLAGRNLDDVAKVLGITVDELKTELASGKKMQDIITGHGMTVEEFNQKILDLKKEAIDQAVADGKLTQEQADKMIQKMTDKINSGVPFNRFGGFNGEKQGFGGRNLDNVANILGITVDQLKSELDSGKKFIDVITGHGLTMDQFKQKMLELKK